MALACHVVLYRPQNAGGLLWRRIARKLSPVVTQDDEDAARHRLTRYLYGEGAPSPRDVPPETQARRTDEQWLALSPAGRKDTGMPPKNSSSSTSPVGSVRSLAVKFLAPIGDYLEQVAGWCCLLLKEKREKKK